MNLALSILLVLSSILMIILVLLHKGKDLDYQIFSVAESLQLMVDLQLSKKT